VGDELSKSIHAILADKGDVTSRAIILLTDLVESRFESLEKQHDSVREDIQNLHAGISTLKNEIDVVRFFSKYPKVLLTIVISIIILVASGVQNIFSFFAKLL
jgi:hypothetical protein